MAGNSTINTKPHSLHLHDTRPHGQSALSPQPMYESGFQFPFQDGYSYPNPFMMLPMPMLMLNNHGLGQNLGGHPFLNKQQHPPVPWTLTQAMNPRLTPIEYPKVTCWFQFLDEHEERSKDGIHFAPYGEVLKDMGFLQITQLTLDFIALKDLQAWLGIKVGTAILIMQYAKMLKVSRPVPWLFLRRRQ